MTYSQIINIKSKLINIDYKFKIDSRIKFRFLTPENQKGIIFKEEVKVDIVNDSNVLDNNWYIFREGMDFSILNQYRFLVLQLYSDSFENKQITIFDDTNVNYYEIYKNNWYNCKDKGPTCGIQLTNFLIDESKPIQEINNLFKYKIEGDASIVKNKYLKAGQTISDVQIIGSKSNIVNFINIFELKSIGKDTTKKSPKSINNVLDLIDNKVFPYFVSENNEINSINARLEMIKFQIKNYFIENNQELDLINKKIGEEKDLNIKQKELLNKLKLTQDKNNSENIKKFSEVEDVILNVNSEISNSNTRISDLKENTECKLSETNKKIDDNDKELDSKIMRNSYIVSRIDQKLSEVSKNSEDNIKSINVILNTINDIDKKTKELENEDVKFNVLNHKIVSEITDLGLKLNNETYELKIQQTEIKNRLEETVKDFGKFTSSYDENKNKLLWSNKENISYFEQTHDSILNTQFYESTEKFMESRLYLIIDSTGIKLPYYSVQVKRVSNNICVARLLQLCSF